MDRVASDCIDNLLEIVRIMHIVIAASTLLLDVRAVESGNFEVDWVLDRRFELVHSYLVDDDVQ